MPTPYDEGFTAGYKNTSQPNPYYKGMHHTEVDALAMEWDKGWNAGQLQAKEDLHQKRLSMRK